MDGVVQALGNTCMSVRSLPRQLGNGTRDPTSLLFRPCMRRSEAYEATKGLSAKHQNLPCARKPTSHPEPSSSDLPDPPSTVGHLPHTTMPCPPHRARSPPPGRCCC